MIEQFSADAAAPIHAVVAPIAFFQLRGVGRHVRRDSLRVFERPVKVVLRRNPDVIDADQLDAVVDPIDVFFNAGIGAHVLADHAALFRRGDDQWIGRAARTETRNVSRKDAKAAKVGKK